MDQTWTGTDRCFIAASRASSTAATPSDLVLKQSQSSAVMVAASNSNQGMLANSSSNAPLSSEALRHSSNLTIPAAPVECTALRFAPPMSSARTGFMMRRVADVCRWPALSAT